MDVLCISMRFFAPLFEPLGAIWLLMVFGVFWLIWRRQWRSAVWSGVPAVLMFLTGSTSLVDAIVARAERPQIVADFDHLAGADVVVALGGGYCLSENDMLGFSLTDGGSRVLTAVELVRRGKAKALVLGGSVPLAGKPGVVAASFVQKWVLDSGLAVVAVTNLGLCANTHDEALRFKELSAQAGWRKVILVTSALHMPRAVAVFAAQGIAVVPVACDFQACDVPSAAGDFSPFPRQTRFHILALYLHEKIGWWVYRARGWV
jgi:uncharacterized SAM-binding protein YcdF (DUF218 family)